MSTNISTNPLDTPYYMRNLRYARTLSTAKNKDIKMPIARKHQIDLSVTSYYHCISRAFAKHFFVENLNNQVKILNIVYLGGITTRNSCRNFRN